MRTHDFEKYVKDQVGMSPKLSTLDEKELLCFGVTGLNEEAGEVAGLLCREVYKKNEMDRDEWKKELGDALWYLTAATLAKGFTLEELAVRNIEKLTERYGASREAERVVAEAAEELEADMVNHPVHYNTGKIEVIEIIKDQLTEEEFRGYIKANVLKYITRERHKNGLEDLKKAAWYLNELIKTLEATEGDSK
jgi:NTP pyrophosphatase (non-canonical NTP hydrolase)